MKDRLKKLKTITIKLSNLADHYVKNTAPSRLPLRASDLEVYPAVKELVNGNGYLYLSEVLKVIVNNRLDDLIPSLSYEVSEKFGRRKYNWYFDIAKPLVAPLKNTKACSIEVNFEINTSDLCKSSFSEKEITYLNKYAKSLEKLITGKVAPKTEAQEHFKQVALDLLKKGANKTRPINFYEKLIVKYIIYTQYIDQKT